MEIPHNIVDLWGVVGGASGALALIVALFMYLAPLTEKPALRMGRRLFLGFCMLALLTATWKLGWLQMRVSVPMWAIIAMPFAPLAVAILWRRSATKRELNHRARPLTEVTIKGITLPIRNGIIADDPVCTKCDWDTGFIPNSPYGETSWRCKNPDCQATYHWKAEGVGDYKDVALAAVNAALRKRGSQQKVDTHYRL